MVSRLKAPAQAVPQTLAEAEALAVKIGERLRSIHAIEASTADAIVKLTAKAKADTAEDGKAVKAEFNALTAFAQAHRDEILPADRKSLAIAAGVIGWRISNPAVEIAKANEEAVIEFLRANGGEHLLIEKTTISKAGLLADRKFAATVPNVAIEQVEQFFFKPLDLDLEQSRDVGKAPAEKAAA